MPHMGHTRFERPLAVVRVGVIRKRRRLLELDLEGLLMVYVFFLFFSFKIPQERAARIMLQSESLMTDGGICGSISLMLARLMV